MAIVLAGIAQRRSALFTFVAVAVRYLGYAAFVRSYFAPILAIACTAFPFRCASWRGAAAPIALVLLPQEAYYLLLHPRDMAADYLAHSSPFGARTSFHNPVAPDSFTAFCTNYLYAVVRVNLPVPFWPGPKEIAMQIFVRMAPPAARRASGARPARMRRRRPCRGVDAVRAGPRQLYAASIERRAAVRDPVLGIRTAHRPAGARASGVKRLHPISAGRAIAARRRTPRAPSTHQYRRHRHEPRATHRANASTASIQRKPQELN